MTSTIIQLRLHTTIIGSIHIQLVPSALLFDMGGLPSAQWTTYIYQIISCGQESGLVVEREDIDTPALRGSCMIQVEEAKL